MFSDGTEYDDDAEDVHRTRLDLHQKKLSSEMRK